MSFVLHAKSRAQKIHTDSQYMKGACNVLAEKSSLLLSRDGRVATVLKRSRARKIRFRSLVTVANEIPDRECTSALITSEISSDCRPDSLSDGTEIIAEFNAMRATSPTSIQ